MNINKIAEKHATSKMRKKDFQYAFKLIDNIQTELESHLDSSRRKYKGVIHTNQLDRILPEAQKQAKLSDAELSTLVAHGLIADILDGLDSVREKWKQLESIHINKEGY
ncbi:TPA: hypothetical protein ACGH17_004553 [Salmonella enterica subsp. enterica serovar Anatum]|nr:hypothetical protein [Salmonella enterica]EBJ9131246.1 hypothetical protein [Salmonella enterica]